MRFLHLSFAFLIAIAGASSALAHEDVVPYALGGKIVTGGHDDVLGTDNITQQVFGYDFGEDPLDPYFIGDPGFNNGAFAIGVYPNNGLLPANFTLGFSVLTNLQFWDGTGSVSFAPALAGIDLGINRGSNTVHFSGSGQSGTVPTIGSTGAAGRVHVHVASLLNAADGTNPNLPNAPDGIYLIGLDLAMAGSELANSDPIYFVYNNGLDEEVHDLAMEEVQENLVVPEPSTWAIMAISAVALAATARRKRGRKRLAVA
jgi:hypothetical protein